MIAASIKATASMRELQRSQGALLRRAADIDSVVDEFKAYCLGDRIDNMFRNNGIIRGKWGLGSTAWAPNTAWVATAKGRNKPMHSANDGASLKNAYVFHRRMAGRGKLIKGSGGLKQVTVSLRLDIDDQKAPHAKYLEKGIGLGRRIYPKKKGGMLAVPIAPGVVAFMPSVRLGARKARHLTGFFRGDLKWLVSRALSRSLAISITGD